MKSLINILCQWGIAPTIQEVGMPYDEKASSYHLKAAYALEKRLYEKADKIIFSFEGGPDYLEDRKWTKQSGYF